MATSAVNRKVPVIPSRYHIQGASRYLVALLAGISLIYFIAICGGEALEPLRQALGLSAFMSDERGVYADCSRAANRSNRFCQKDFSSVTRPAKSSRPTSFSENPKNSLPFSLGGGK